MNAFNITRLGIGVLAIGISLGSSLTTSPDPALAGLIESIEGTGTTVTKKVCSGEDKDSFGYYQVSQKIDELVICTNNIKGDEDLYAETLKHEAIHVAQACKQWKSATNITEEWHTKKAAESYDIEQMKTEHDETQWSNELEAYSLEGNSAAYISGVVDAACNG
jgi:hypothetical protein